MTAAFCRYHCEHLSAQLPNTRWNSYRRVSISTPIKGGDAREQFYRAPDVLGGAMMDGGAASPVESVPAAAGGRPQPVPVALEVVAVPVVAPAVVPVPQDLIVPELLVAPGPVVPAPEGATAPGAGVVADGDPTTPALLPLRPEAPTPAPVPGAAPGLPLVVCAIAMPDTPINSAAARGRILIAFMEDSHIRDVMWVERPDKLKRSAGARPPPR
jgi:hypothetical protein